MGDGKQLDAVDPAKTPPNRLKGAEALKAHVTLAVGLALCIAAFAFEIGRALGGNSLSWAYVFEWPLLGGFAVYMWWKVIHPENQAMKDELARSKQIAPEFNGMLAAWQAHQEELAQSRDTSASDGEHS